MGISTSNDKIVTAKPRITLLGSQSRELTSFLDSHPSGYEKAAIVLFKRIRVSVDGLSDSDRYLAVRVISFADEWVVDSSAVHIEFKLESFRELFRECEENNLVFGFVHNHPTGMSEFSEMDEENEVTLVEALRNRNGKDVSFVSLLWTGGRWKGRVRNGMLPNQSLDVRHVLVLSESIGLHDFSEINLVQQEIYSRQAAAFGSPFVKMLASLRIAVIGCGGTGSAIATLLSRIGIGELVLIDKDKLEHSNLNRVRGSAIKNVGENKAEILRDFINSLGFSVKVSAIPSLIDLDPIAVDALASCDVVIGCTDDQIGREILNTALYVYCLALIDLGLGGNVQEDERGIAILRNHHARISTILPEYGECLFCQGAVTEKGIQLEYALRANPDMTEEEKKERYLENSGENAPGIAPFTGAAADFAVANLFDLLRGFRRYPEHLRKDFYNINFVNMDIRSIVERGNTSCPYCQKKGFLLIHEESRLNRPLLGKRDKHV